MRTYRVNAKFPQSNPRVPAPGLANRVSSAVLRHKEKNGLPSAQSFAPVKKNYRRPIAAPMVIGRQRVKRQYRANASTFDNVGYATVPG